jgi:hypothetical protein
MSICRLVVVVAVVNGRSLTQADRNCPDIHVEREHKRKEEEPGRCFLTLLTFYSRPRQHVEILCFLYDDVCTVTADVIYFAFSDVAVPV